jgi:hypothetical protein
MKKVLSLFVLVMFVFFLAACESKETLKVFIWGEYIDESLVELFEETYDVKFLDKFEAILTSPLDYISMLIPDDWFGIVCRKTTTSDKFAKEAFDNIRENC